MAKGNAPPAGDDGPLVLNLDAMAEFASKWIVSKTLVEKDGFDVTLFCMAAGQALSEHTTVFHAMVHVLRGRGVFRLDAQDHPAVPGAWFYMPPHHLPPRVGQGSSLSSWKWEYALTGQR